MSEIITIEAVSDKFKNKYSSGSVKAGGKWMQVASKLDIELFQKDSQMEVETKTNDKGYISIVDVTKQAKAKLAELPPKAVSEPGPVTDVVSVKSYDDNRNRRILVQGVVQAVVQAPSLAGLPFTTTEDVVKNVKEVSLKLISFIEDNI